jgi:hypothetical protein
MKYEVLKFNNLTPKNVLFLISCKDEYNVFGFRKSSGEVENYYANTGVETDGGLHFRSINPLEQRQTTRSIAVSAYIITCAISVAHSSRHTQYVI